MARRLGAAYSYGDDNWGVTASCFGRELTQQPATRTAPATALRGYWAPINDKGSILHFGLSYVELRHRCQDTAALRARARTPTSPASAWSTPAT